MRRFKIKLARRLASFILVLAVLAGVALPISTPVLAASGTQNQICQGIGVTGGSCSSGGGTSDINHLITNGLNIFSTIVGIVAVIMIIVGGFKYITSGGESNAVASAKHTLMYALVGLVIVALAQVIARFVLGNI